ncbi:putative kinase mug58 [Cladobotryum mycophilum]|uniref:Kinase mug58 n=1 Tax=Cladobotryum mycophilum TaxID=491253 RepID=A0ABR0T357_9HYPO
MPAEFIDDKAPICIPFILDRLKTHHQQTSSSSSHNSHRPFIVGLNGLQGVGKTTLVALLTAALESRDIPTLVCSIDDFYLTHDDQVALARDNPDNALWQHRGEPGTHDIPLAKSFFTSLLTNSNSNSSSSPSPTSSSPLLLPQYDKAAFSGQVIILEGWCVGFRPLAPSRLQAKHQAPSRTLRNHRLEHLLLVNEKLGEYDALTDLFDAFIHIDSEDVEYVYDWRLEQEEHLREIRGDPNAGMSKAQVIKFVDAYFPGYELYTEGVRNGLLLNHPGSQLRLVVGRDRKVKQVVEI